MAANKTIKIQKRKLSSNENNKNDSKINNEIETKEIHSIYNAENYNKSYLRTSIKLFQDYKDYITKNINLTKKRKRIIILKIITIIWLKWIMLEISF